MDKRKVLWIVLIVVIVVAVILIIFGKSKIGGRAVDDQDSGIWPERGCKSIGLACSADGRCCSGNCDDGTCVRGDVPTEGKCKYSDQCENEDEICCYGGFPRGLRCLPLEFCDLDN